MKIKPKITNKEIVSEIARDIRRVVKSATSNSAKFICKASYPITGNLSNNVQTGLEKLLGSEQYNAKQAYNVSLRTNIIFYSLLAGGFVGYKIHQVPIENFANHPILQPEASKVTLIGAGSILATGGAVFIGALEWHLRSENSENHFSDRRYSASLAGKLISLPFDIGISCYNHVDKYIREIKYRVENRKKSELSNREDENGKNNP